MQTVQLNIQLDISRDILDKVMFLLDNLPKNKVKLKVMNNIFTPLPHENSSSSESFFHTLRNRNIKIDKNINIDNIMNEMNDGLS